MGPPREDAGNGCSEQIGPTRRKELHIWVGYDDYPIANWQPQPADPLWGTGGSGRGDEGRPASFWLGPERERRGRWLAAERADRRAERRQ
jgi:hypothetical protein